MSLGGNQRELPRISIAAPIVDFNDSYHEMSMSLSAGLNKDGSGCVSGMACYTTCLDCHLASSNTSTMHISANRKDVLGYVGKCAYSLNTVNECVIGKEFKWQKLKLEEK